uniref:Secreted protein n=1 Tax=Piliocolobus tephrosceles TaxID=591936 RepID=A0A8C9HRA6_9PRIM
MACLAGWCLGLTFFEKCWLVPALVKPGVVGGGSALTVGAAGIQDASRGLWLPVFMKDSASASTLRTGSWVAKPSQIKDGHN